MKAFLLGVTVAMATIAAAPSGAQEAPQAKVKVRDLDLTSPAGRQAADQRLRGSAKSQCPDANGADLNGAADARACRNELVTKGRSQIAVAAAEAENARIAEARRIVAASDHRRMVRHAAVHRRPAHRRVVHRRVVKHGHVVHKRVVVTHTN